MAGEAREAVARRAAPPIAWGTRRSLGTGRTPGRSVGRWGAAMSPDAASSAPSRPFRGQSYIRVIGVEEGLEVAQLDLRHHQYSPRTQTIDACGKRADSLSRNLSAEAPRRSRWYEPRLRVVVLFDYQRALASHCACSWVHRR